MRAKILNKSIDSTKEELKVLSINYDFVAVQINDDKKVIRRDEVELIFENDSEKILDQYEDILKIKLNKGMTFAFYPTLINFIEDIVGRKVEQIDVLEDEFKFIKKGIWEKNLLIVINNLRTFKISAIGQKYGDNFSFTIKEINLSNFLKEYELKIKALEEEIKERQILKNKYEETLKNVINNSIINNESILLNN
ncbi:hypothetical protein [Clostridium aciditolerans]|uniref:Uncharacterized protein n=1 Tax=Clostridium aciditolerans TaxID=339861 RepID=A0A934M4R7_9CLOT|nr:hypothetical protein [Clostridium aciditolerans]MBI6872863.1 hypothetical protein [Clostridium aciditolerans]